MRQLTFTVQTDADPRSFFRIVTEKVLKTLRENEKTRVRLVLRFRMERTSMTTGEVISEDAAFSSQVEENLEADDEREVCRGMTGESLENMANFQRMDSNWRFARVIQVELHFVDFDPLRAGSWIKLPRGLKSKKAVINMRNEDNKCFKWSVTRSLNPDLKHPERVKHKLVLDSRKYDRKDLSFPVKLKDIWKFEKNNPGISLNVFGYEKNVYPLRVSKVKGKAVDLLLISEEDKQHYCVVKNLSRLLSSQFDSHEHESFVCRRCLNHFTSEERLETQLKICSQKDLVKIEMKEGTVRFKNYNRSMKVPFVIYADFEAVNKKVSETKGRTKKHLEHKAGGFCFQVVCFDESIRFDPVLSEPQVRKKTSGRSSSKRLRMN